VVVKKVSTAFLMAISLVATDTRYDSLFLTNYAQINLVNQIGSLPGVGESRLSSQQVYSMRVWVNPDKMTKLGVTPRTSARRFWRRTARIRPARSARPLADRHRFSVRHLRSRPPDRSLGIRDIVIRAQPDASLLRVRDIGRAELGAQTYTGLQPAEREAIRKRDRVSHAGRERRADGRRGSRLHGSGQGQLPRGHSLRGAVQLHDVCARRDQGRGADAADGGGLVVFVVFMFLQNWRATLIPLLTVPVAVVGTFALFPVLGFSIQHHQHVRTGARDRYRWWTTRSWWWRLCSGISMTG